MNTAELRVHIDAYLNLRGSLGLQTEITGYYLRELSNYVEAQGFSWPIRTQTILEWISAASPHCGLSGQRTRLTQARCFLKHLKASVPDTEVPGPGLLPHQPRPKPRWYSAEEITKLQQATLRLWEPGSLSQRTPYLIIGLLASTGLRAGEVTALTVDDVRLTSLRETSLADRFSAPIQPRRSHPAPDHWSNRPEILTNVSCKLETNPHRHAVAA